MYYLDEDCFPADYDWLTQEQQEGILSAVKEYRKNAVNLWRDYQSHKGTDESEYFRQAWRRAEDIACAIDRFLLDVLNIHVEYNWCGHRNKYFLATYNDAVSENDYYYDIAHDAEGDVDEYRIGRDDDSDYVVVTHTNEIAEIKVPTDIFDNVFYSKSKNCTSLIKVSTI